MSFSIIMIIKKIFSVILYLSNNTKYHRPDFMSNQVEYSDFLCLLLIIYFIIRISFLIILLKYFWVSLSFYVVILVPKQ